MELLNKSKTNFKERPIKVLQFGEGGFLRAFVDYMIDIANEKGDFDGNIVVVKPIEFGNLDFFHQQDCQYTLELRGKENGEAKKVRRQITSVADAIGAVEDYDKFMDYARQVTEQLDQEGIRVELDVRSEKIGYKIREAQMQKVPYMLVVGQKEAEDGVVAVRSRFLGDEGQKPLEEFITSIKAEIESKEIRKVEVKKDK